MHSSQLTSRGPRYFRILDCHGGSLSNNLSQLSNTWVSPQSSQQLQHLWSSSTSVLLSNVKPLLNIALNGHEHGQQRLIPRIIRPAQPHAPDRHSALPTGIIMKRSDKSPPLMLRSVPDPHPGLTKHRNAYIHNPRCPHAKSLQGGTCGGFLSCQQVFQVLASPGKPPVVEIVDDFAIYFCNKVVLLVLRAVDNAHDEERR